MEPEVLAQYEHDRLRLVQRRQKIRTLKPVGLAVGAALAFIFGGFPGLIAAFLTLAIVRVFARR